MKDFDIEENEHFVKHVFIPYFKDIYRDLAERSDKKSSGINRIVFIEVRHRHFLLYSMLMITENTTILQLNIKLKQSLYNSLYCIILVC